MLGGARAPLPETIRSDNGSPFAGTGAAGLSRLSVGWLKAGIALELDPGRPQQNGRHERMHKTLKRRSARGDEQAQVRFDYASARTSTPTGSHLRRWASPPAFWQPSPRPWPERLEEPWYDAWHARRVAPTARSSGAEF